MSSAGAALSNQDLEDLNEIRSRLPQGDPRASKILNLVGQHAQEPTQFEQDRSQDVQAWKPMSKSNIAPLGPGTRNR